MTIGINRRWQFTLHGELLGWLFFMPAAVSSAKDRDYDDCGRIIHPYTMFRSMFSDFEDSPALTSKKNYEVFITIKTEEYKTAFSLEEIRAIATFYASPLGKRLLGHSLKSKATRLFLERVRPLVVWVRGEHPQIRLAQKGNCPICGQQLKMRKVSSGKPTKAKQ